MFLGRFVYTAPGHGLYNGRESVHGSETRAFADHRAVRAGAPVLFPVPGQAIAERSRLQQRAGGPGICEV